MLDGFPSLNGREVFSIPNPLKSFFEVDFPKKTNRLTFRNLTFWSGFTPSRLVFRPIGMILSPLGLLRLLRTKMARFAIVTIDLCENPNSPDLQFQVAG